MVNITGICSDLNNFHIKKRDCPKRENSLIHFIYFFNRSLNASANGGADAGLWPVIKAPSITTLGAQLATLL